MRTAAWETAPRVALRNCSKRQFIYDFGEGGICAVKHIFFQKIPTSLMKLLLVTRNSGYHEGFSAFVAMRRYKNWAHKIKLAPENI